MSDVASANAASWPGRPAWRGMAVEPIAAFVFAAVVSTLPARTSTGHSRQGTAVPGNLFSQFPRSLAEACPAEGEREGDSLLLAQ